MDGTLVSRKNAQNKKNISKFPDPIDEIIFKNDEKANSKIS